MGSYSDFTCICSDLLWQRSVPQIITPYSQLLALGGHPCGKVRLEQGAEVKAVIPNLSRNVNPPYKMVYSPTGVITILTLTAH